MVFQLPSTLLAADDDSAIGLLRAYFGPAFGTQAAFTGAAFDCWDSTGTRAADVDRFTADDLVSLSFLSIKVTARMAHAVLEKDATALSRLLVKLGPDRDLAHEAAVLGEDWPGRYLFRKLYSLPDVGPVTAAKLMARKRPRLIPVWDTVVAKVTNTVDGVQWEPLRVALRDGSPSLQSRLETLRDKAGLDRRASPLRVLDVIAWMEGKGRLRAGASLPGKEAPPESLQQRAARID